MMAIGDSHRTLVLLGFVVYTHNCRKCYILVGGQWKWKILLFPVCVHWSLNATHSPSGVCTPMWRSHIRFKTTTDSGGLWATRSPVAWELLWLLFSVQMKRPSGTVKASESGMNFSLKVMTSICHHPRHVSEVTLETMAEAWAGSFNKRYMVPIVGTTKLSVVLEKHDWVGNVRIWEH